MTSPDARNTETGCQPVSCLDGHLVVCTLDDDSIARSFGYASAAHVTRIVKARLSRNANAYRAKLKQQRAAERHARHAAILTMRDAGLTLQQIATAFGQTRQNISVLLKRRGRQTHYERKARQ